MRVIPPITITESILTSSNVPEDDYDEWSNGATFGLGDFCIIIDSSSPPEDVHKVYESLQAGNIGHNPIDDDQDAPVYWLEIGPTNRWKMFDVLRNTQTEIESPLIVVLTPAQRINSIALLGLEADEVNITMMNGLDTLYNETINLVDRETLNWTDYFFGQFTTKAGIAKFDLPLVTTGVITVTVSRTGSTSPLGDVSVGSLVIGNSEYLGEVEYKAISDALNFSTVERNEFGDSLLVPRRSVPKTLQTIFVDKNRINRLLTVRSELNAVPAVWSGLDDDETHGYFNALLILGFYRIWTINMDYPEQALMSLELEEI
jgi:hypothetical protein